MRIHTLREAAIRRSVSLGAAALLGMAACTSGDSIIDPENRTETLPWALQLNYDAITAAVGEPVQLQVTPVSVDGTPMPATIPVTYTAADTSVKIDATGRLIGTQARSNVLVVAKMQNLEENWTRADSVRVKILDAPVQFSSFEMTLNGPALTPANRARRFDSALYDATGAVILDAEGDTLRPLTYYAASVPKNVYDITNPWNATGFARNIGDVTVRGTAYIFGFEYEDEVAFQIAYPDSAVLNIYRVSTFLNPSPSMMSQTDLTVLRGGKVSFRNLNTTESVDIVFDDLGSVVNGNIAVVPATSAASGIVTFPNLGQFTYSSSKGFGGTITVVDP